MKMIMSFTFLWQINRAWHPRSYLQPLNIQLHLEVLQSSRTVGPNQPELSPSSSVLLLKAIHVSLPPRYPALFPCTEQILIIFHLDCCDT